MYYLIQHLFAEWILRYFFKFVQLVDNSSYHVRWNAPVVLQICQGLRIGFIDPFLEVPREEVVTRVHVTGVGWPKEVDASRNESITRKTPTKEFQRCLNNNVVLHLVGR